MQSNQRFLLKQQVWIFSWNQFHENFVKSITKKIPCSSTNPVSWRDFWQVPCEQVKWDGHHVLPNAVIKGPLKKYNSSFGTF